MRKRGSSWPNGLIHGVGVRDITCKGKDGKTLKSYITWYNMLRRCYDPRGAHIEDYKGCTVSEDWLTFSNYKMWYDANYFEGCNCDKDLIIFGNKVYSENTCLMITEKVNQFFTVTIPKNGRLSGVNPARLKYVARLQGINGNSRASKSVSTQELAHDLYCEGKQQRAIELIEGLHPNQQYRAAVINSLLTYVDYRFGPVGNRFYIYGT